METTQMQAVPHVAREAIEIVNQKGLHARASAKFVNAVTRLPDVDVKVLKDGIEAAGGSILGLMMLGAAKGNKVELIVSGPEAEAEAALLKLSGLIRDGFGED